MIYNDRKTLAKADALMTRIFVLTRKKRQQGCCVLVITWAESGLRFQHPLIMGLREAGMISLSGDGFYLRREFEDYTLEELRKYRDS